MTESFIYSPCTHENNPYTFSHQTHNINQQQPEAEKPKITEIKTAQKGKLIVWISKFLNGENPNHLDHFGFLSFSPEIEEAKWKTRRGNSPKLDTGWHG